MYALQNIVLPLIMGDYYQIDLPPNQFTLNIFYTLFCINFVQSILQTP